MVREVDLERHNSNPWNAVVKVKKIGVKKAKASKKIKTPLAQRRDKRRSVVNTGFAKGRNWPAAAPYNPGRHRTTKPRKPITGKYLQKYWRDKTVAVVGNSFTPRDISKEVDNHDIVIRFNLDRRRLGWGYSSIRPPVPAGEKVNVMCAYWSNMNVPRILKNFPTIAWFFSVRPGALARYNRAYTDAGLYQVNKPVYDPPIEQYKEIAKICGDPVLTGMGAAHIMSLYNTAEEINFYNFNFFVPALNPNNRDVKRVYMRYLHGRKGDKRYGSKKRPHRLTKSYIWFKKLINSVDNMNWKMTDEEFQKMDAFLL